MRNQTAMRIHVLADEAINPQARTYAEYRVFAALSQLVDTLDVGEARVVLRPARHQGRDGVVCTVAVVLNGADALHVRTTGEHPYAAINRAVERLSRSTRRAPQPAGAGVDMRGK
jgi:ribosome-associated translation inhibitor RaiA